MEGIGQTMQSAAQTQTQTFQQEGMSTSEITAGVFFEPWADRKKEEHSRARSTPLP